MEAGTQWREEDGDGGSATTCLEPSGELSPPPVLRTTQWDTAPDAGSDMFGEVECGEPMVPQRIVLDFPLLEDPDSEDMQQKVRAFWEFLETHPELDNLICVEDEQKASLESISSVTPELTFSDDEPSDQQTTALSTLCLFEATGAVDRAFHTKMRNTTCDLELPSYFGRSTAPLKEICIPDATSSSGDNRTTPSSEKLSHVTRAIWTWDERHPKSMDPPGHPPPLAHAELVRAADNFLDSDDSLRSPTCFHCRGTTTDRSNSGPN